MRLTLFAYALPQKWGEAILFLCSSLVLLLSGNLKTRLRMKYPNCGHWSSIPVGKIFVEQPSPEARVKAYASHVRAYENRNIQEMRKKSQLNPKNQSESSKPRKHRTYSCSLRGYFLSLYLSAISLQNNSALGCLEIACWMLVLRFPFLFVCSSVDVSVIL